MRLNRTKSSIRAIYKYANEINAEAGFGQVR